MRNLWAHGAPGAGLVAGIGAVVLNQSVNYVLVPWICATQINPVPVIAIALAATALFGALLSWRALTAAGPSLAETHAGGHPHAFLAGISILFALLCAALVLTQGAAGLVFNGCER